MSAISESLCSGCGICIKKCPLQAVKIINLPHSLTKDTVHRYGANGFKLHRLPIPRRGQVLGLLGANGMGKSTALAILSGKLKPNFGETDAPQSWKEIAAHFRGHELQSYFTQFAEGNLHTAMKAQYVERLGKSLGDDILVGEFLAEHESRHVLETVSRDLEIAHLLDRQVSKLSGGEMQRIAIANVCTQEADIYMIDEPSAFLDVRQRLRAAVVIHNLLQHSNYVIVVEHDIAVLEYVSDFVCCLYGEAAGYGVVTMPSGVRDGINIFLSGFIPSENLRFRVDPLTFHMAECPNRPSCGMEGKIEYPNLMKTLSTERGAQGFALQVAAGSCSSSEVIVMLGQNGVGKTTLIKLLAGRLEPDTGDALMPQLSVSHKPQALRSAGTGFKGRVRDVLTAKIHQAMLDPVFKTEVVQRLGIDQIWDLEVQGLSGGELQRLNLVLALGKPADIYLIDEPSAYLDVEQRIAAAKALRRFMLQFHKTSFIVEHDFIMATYLADRVIVFDGQPGVSCCASAPMSLLEGMNLFLKQLAITFRRDSRNLRPRINKVGGGRDREQKKLGQYFVLED